MPNTIYTYSCERSLNDDNKFFFTTKLNITRKKMDVQLWDSHLIFLIVLSRCSTVISKILISAYFNIVDITPEYLDITTKHIRWLFHS